MSITLNKIVAGAIAAIKAEFGTGYKIYSEEIEQGLKEPCFFVQLLNPTNKRFLGNRRYLTNLVMVQYFPKSKIDKYSEINDVIERLQSCLEYITCGEDLCEGKDASSVIDNGILNFQISYDMFVRFKDSNKEVMKEVTHSQKVMMNE